MTATTVTTVTATTRTMPSRVRSPCGSPISASDGGRCLGPQARLGWSEPFGPPFQRASAGSEGAGMKHLVRVVVVLSAASLLFATPASAHVRTANTSLKLSVSDSKVKQGTKVTWTIKLKSPWSKCIANQPVRWYKKGTFKKNRTTNANGILTFTKKMNHTGTFQAKYQGRKWGKHPHKHTCKPSVSNKVKVKVTRKH